MSNDLQDQDESGAPEGAQVSDDQAAALAALQAGAAAPEEAGQGQQTQIQDDASAEADAIVEAVAMVVEAKWPCLQYSQAARTQMSKVLAPVLAKHGMNSEFMKRFGEEVALGTVLATMGWQSYKAVQQDKAEKAKQASSENG